MSSPIVLACPTDASSGGRSTPPPWHADAVGGRPPHQGRAMAETARSGPLPAGLGRCQATNAACVTYTAPVRCRPHTPFSRPLPLLSPSPFQAAASLERPAYSGQMDPAARPRYPVSARLVGHQGIGHPAPPPPPPSPPPDVGGCPSTLGSASTQPPALLVPTPENDRFPVPPSPPSPGRGSLGGWPSPMPRRRRGAARRAVTPIRSCPPPPPPPPRQPGQRDPGPDRGWHPPRPTPPLSTPPQAPEIGRWRSPAPDRPSAAGLAAPRSPRPAVAVGEARPPPRLRSTLSRRRVGGSSSAAASPRAVDRP